MTVPSLPVFTAIEETRRGHGYRNPLTQLCDCGEELASEEKWRFHVTVEVARAAEVAALHALARWALADRESRTHDLRDETLIPTWVIRDRADAIKQCMEE